MIASASGSAPDLVPLDVLQRRLREALSQKRYLLILDDVWNDNEDMWVMLKSILGCGSKGASIVVTTRLQKVAAIMGTLPAHCLTGLSEEHCWLLFRLRAFGQENEEHLNLETIGRQIVKKCAGVPLAAKALGGLLRFKRKEKEWIHVKESETWNLPEGETSILPVLRLSYHHLPLVLKQCFVYCAVFPKDHEIEKQDLIFRWMAHGCISSNGTQEVEDVGDHIWNELVLRSFFQEVEARGRETTFKMHDLVHDLAQSLMENKIPGAQTKDSSVSASNNKIREAYLTRNSMTCLSSIRLEVSSLTNIADYNRLRILKLNWARMEELPSAIGKLKHLRYLDLSHSSIHALPHTICNLWNLQILILIDCEYLKSLPKRISYMSNLRHIILERCKELMHMPPGIKKLTFLKTLSLYIVGHRAGSQLDELEFLDLGGQLEIKHLERIQNHMNAKKANLVGKPNLRDLVLRWEGDSTADLAKMRDEKVLEALEPHPNLRTLEVYGFKGGYFPLWMKKMENVTRIIIRNCPNCSRLSPLGDLPHLKSLILGNLAGLEYIVEDEIRVQTSVRAKFPSLEELKLRYLPNLKGLLKEVVGESILFPNLQGLYIVGCVKLTLPPLPTLEKLEIEKCSLLTLSSFSKLQNLSSLDLGFDDGFGTTTCIPEESLEDLCNLKKLGLRNARDYCLPKKWFRGLKSLKQLDLTFCNIGSCFPEGWLGHLTALEYLKIQSCEGWVEVPEEIKYLHLLKGLQLCNLDGTLSLPQGLQHLRSLQSLLLFSLPQLTSLPDSLGNLTSLTLLEIISCPRVPSLPSTIQGMTKLGYLTILDCPRLERQCEKEKGEDWHKIAHIPNLDIRRNSYTSEYGQRW